VGQQIRLLSINSDAGAGLGVFEDLHGSASGGEFADRLKRNAAEYYGAVGRAYLEYLVEHRQAIKQEILAQIAAFTAANKISGSGSEVYRALQRFALIGVAGELATKIGLTGWEKGESLSAAVVCFKSWIGQRGTTGGSDIESGIRQVRLFIERHGSTRFQNLDLHGVTCVNNRAGCKDVWKDPQAKDQKAEDAITSPPYQYYIFTETFKQEVCAGYDSNAIAKALAERGHLVIQDKGRNSYKKTISGIGRPRVYHILPSLFEDQENDRFTETVEGTSDASQG
jgi:putative DNA primase/helicase